MQDLARSTAARKFETARQKVVDTFQRLRDFCNLLVEPQFALATPGGLIVSTVPASPKTSPVSFFDTGALPSKGSIPWQIANWDSVEVHDSSKPSRPDKPRVSIPTAQKALTALLRDPDSTHEYLTYEAAKLCSRTPLVVQYTLHLVTGALAEDFVFAPGETLDNLYLAKLQPHQMPSSPDDFIALSGRELTFWQKAFRFLSRMMRKLFSNAEKDQLNRPYLAHFFDPTLISAEHDGGLSIVGDQLRFQSALTRIKMYWSIASEYYQQGDMPRTFCALGHMLHLLQDLHVPAHVHNDTHAEGDSLERWATRTDYLHMARTPKEPNVRIWNSKPLTPPKADGWTMEEISSKLESFVLGIVAHTGRFRSIHKAGTEEGESDVGIRLSSGECCTQARTLVPLAILDGAQLLANFLDFHARYYPEVAIERPEYASLNG